MTQANKETIHTIVRQHYADIAVGESSSCCAPASQNSLCCAPTPLSSYSQQIGYSAETLAVLPDGADLGLGCGNPTAFAALHAGETVLDLGSGGGMDVFIAAKQVGHSGTVIGVDMTQDMIDLAWRNAAKGDFTQVDFRLGFIEELPVADASVDVVISNCVVNLSPDKAKVFRECFRVLKPGGRISISDPVRVADMPEDVMGREDAYCSCIAGAASREELQDYLHKAGFSQVKIYPKGASAEVINSWTAGDPSLIAPGQYVISMMIEAQKPDGSQG